MFFSDPEKLKHIPYRKGQAIPEKNLSTVIDHEKQGIPPRDLVALMDYVNKNKVILLFRPVEIIAKSLHQEKKYPTKNFNIKGKTANWGAWGGFIPINQAYSKFALNLEQIDKYNQEVQNCITQGHAIIKPLTISAERYQELINDAFILPQKKTEEDYLVLKCPRPDSDIFELCYAKIIQGLSGTEYAIYTAEKKPFQILVDPASNMPFIPDYDLLAVVFHWERFGRALLRPNPDITHANRVRKLSPNEKRNSKEGEKNFNAREIPNFGNISPQIREEIEKMNQALNKGPHLDCIHHNDDAGSPASNPTVNYPITALIPSGLKGFSSKILLLESVEEFVTLIQKLNPLGYRIESNPLWEQPVQLAVNRPFYQKKMHFDLAESKSPGSIEASLHKIFNLIGLSDQTLITEISWVLSLIIKSDVNIQIDRYFNIIQSCLLVHSSLMTQWCKTLQDLLNKKLLTEKIFSRLLTFMDSLKEDITGFNEISETFINYPNLTANKLDQLFDLAKHCIRQNKISKLIFRNGLKKMPFLLVLQPEIEKSIETTGMQLKR